MAKLEIDTKRVNYCMDASFDEMGDYTSYNEILRSDRENANIVGV